MPLIVVGFALLFYLSALGLGVSFTSLLIAHTVISVPYIIRTVAGVYRGVSPDYEETAAVLGANRLQIFWHVTLPMIKPGIFAGMLFAMLISIDNLPISFFFGSAHTNTLPVVMLSYLEHPVRPVGRRGEQHSAPGGGHRAVHRRADLWAGRDGAGDVAVLKGRHHCG